MLPLLFSLCFFLGLFGVLPLRVVCPPLVVPFSHVQWRERYSFFLPVSLRAHVHAITSWVGLTGPRCPSSGPVWFLQGLRSKVPRARSHSRAHMGSDYAFMGRAHHVRASFVIWRPRDVCRRLPMS
ncbi:hypothetical protein C2E23DRAFT_45729 [Lenzites betulinus]|nr:hypothetical protein C2E23DRAFT_45729 [Lenzites betulinus]